MNLREDFELYKRLKREDGSLKIDSSKRYSAAVIPESASQLVSSISKSFSDKIIRLKKRSISEIISLLDRQPMQRVERQKLMSIVSGLDHLAMHSIPGNQRWRFETILFYPMNVDKYESVILVDDSSFSGWTMKAMKYAVSKYDDSYVAFNY